MLEETNKKLLNKSLKGIVKSSVIIFFILLASNIVTYIYRLIIARYYGPEGYGLFSLAVMVVGIFTAIFSLGLTDGLSRFIPLYNGEKKSSKVKYLINYSLKILIITGLTGGIIMFFSSELIANKIFHENNLTDILKLFSLLVPITLLINIFVVSLVSFEKVVLQSFIYNLVPNISRVILITTFIILGFNFWAIFHSYFWSLFVLLLLSFIFYKRTIKFDSKDNLNYNGRKLVRSEMFNYSMPLILFALVIKTNTWIDSFAIGYFLNATEVGFYNSALPIATLLLLTPQIFLQLFVPLINKEFAKKNNHLIKQMGQQVGKWIYAVNLPIFILFFIFPEAIINILFGSEYIVAANSLRILSFGAFIYTLASSSEKLVLMAGKSRITLLNIVITSVIGIILNILLVPRLGIDGAAISTASIWIILSIFLFVEGYYYTKIIPLRRKMIRITAMGFISLGLLLLLRSFIKINILSLIVLSLTFFLVYCLLLLISGSLDKNDWMVIKAIKGKAFGIKRNLKILTKKLNYLNFSKEKQ